MVDWRQMAEVGRRMGFGDAFGFETATDVFSEHAALSAYENNGERDFDIGAYSGIKAAEFETLVPFQWPQAKGEVPKDTRFFTDGAFFAADRKARFVPVSWEGNRRRAGHFITMNTGRVRDQWHRMARRGKTARLTQHIAEPFAETHTAGHRGTEFCYVAPHALGAFCRYGLQGQPAPRCKGCGLACRRPAENLHTRKRQLQRHDLCGCWPRRR